MTGRDTILAAIRQGLARHGEHLERLASATSRVAPGFVHPRAEHPVRQFEQELTALDVRTHAADSMAAALAVVETVLIREGARSVLAWNEEEVGLDGLEAMLRARGISRRGQGQEARNSRAGAPGELAGADVGITGVDVAIAESGTLVVATGPGRSRLASLLAPVHIAVVRESQVVRGLGEALGRLRDRYGDTLFRDRSNVTFITGPSRTADIELTLTLGVHGPRLVDVVILR